MMDEHKHDKFVNAIDMVNPFQKVIIYFIFGFLIASFQIDVGFLPILSSLISLLCFYLGLRMVRNENKTFFWAYVLNIILMIMTVLEALLLATTIAYSSAFVTFCIGIKYLQIILISLGLKQCIPTHHYPLYIIMSYTAMLSVLLLYNKDISMLIFLGGFISLLYWLGKIYNYLIYNQYQLKLTPIKISEKVMWMGYIGITSLLVIGITLSFPFFAYHYIEKDNSYYETQLLDSRERTNSDSLIQNEETKANIYDYHDYYLYVYHFQFEDIQQLMTSLVISVEQEKGNTDQIVEDIWVGNGEKQYQIKNEDDVPHRLPSFFNSFGYANNYYIIDVNPLDPHLDITISIKVTKGKTDTVSNYRFQFFFQNGFHYPYSSDYGINIQRSYTSYNGKWGYPIDDE